MMDGCGAFHASSVHHNQQSEKDRLFPNRNVMIHKGQATTPLWKLKKTRLRIGTQFEHVICSLIWNGKLGMPVGQALQMTLRRLSRDEIIDDQWAMLAAR
jgi:hypothetical protein